MTSRAFTDEDRMFPVYCLLCRTHIPRVTSDSNAGYCIECRNFTLQDAIRNGGRYDRKHRHHAGSKIGVA